MWQNPRTPPPPPPEEPVEPPVVVPPVTGSGITKGSQILTTGVSTGIKKLGIERSALPTHPGGALEPGTYSNVRFLNPIRANSAGDRHIVGCSMVISTATYLVQGVNTAAFIIEDSEFGQTGTDVPSAVVNAYNTQIYRSELWGGVDICKVRRGFLVDQCWLHGLIRVDAGHHDVLQTATTKASGGRVNDVTIRRSRIDALDPITGINGARCVIISANDCTAEDWIVEDNFFNGGGDRSTEWGLGGVFPTSGLVVRRNQWSKVATTATAKFDDSAPGNSWEYATNVYLEDGLPVR
jgi:hypothetical protein